MVLCMPRLVHLEKIRGVVNFAGGRAVYVPESRIGTAPSRPVWP
jgi:hypothetical protein